MSHVTPTEALYAYAAWLTARRREIRIGAEHERGPVVYTLLEFCAFNPDWTHDLVCPVPTYFSPSSNYYEWEVRIIHLPLIRLKCLWSSFVR